MSHECKIEYYFKRGDLEKLLNANPNAKGIIVSQQIIKAKPKGAEHFVNLVKIRARVDLDPTNTAAKAAAIPGEAEIDGCPFPPGCTDE